MGTSAPQTLQQAPQRLRRLRQHLGRPAELAPDGDGHGQVRAEQRDARVSERGAGDGFRTAERDQASADLRDALLDAAISAARLDAVQLHKVTPERAAAVRARVPVWAAVAVKTRADLALANAFRGASDRILYDAKTPEGAALPGGMGLRFDWKLLDGFAHPLPWALSGGLAPDNVREAMEFIFVEGVEDALSAAIPGLAERMIEPKAA